MSRLTESLKFNTFGIKFLFPKDSALTSLERARSECGTKIEVEFLYQAPNYDIVYEGPLDKAVLPVDTKLATAGRNYILLRVRALNGAKPLVVGFPSEEVSMMAKFWVPIMERQESLVVAIEDRTRGHIARWCRAAILGPRELDFEYGLEHAS